MADEEVKEKKAEEPKRPAPQDRLVQTQHSVVIGGQEIQYTATTGVIVLKEESEKKGDKEGESEGEQPRATIFFTAYTRESVSEPNQRPIAFCFNGGPGSSSVWLHLGAFGPRRVKLTDEGELCRRRLSAWWIMNSRCST